MKFLTETDPALEVELTVRITLDPALKPYSRQELFASICRDSGVAPQEIIALGPLMDNSRWSVMVTSKAATARLMSKPPVVKGKASRVTVFNSTLVRVRIHWLPTFIPMSIVVAFICQYGYVNFSAWDVSNQDGMQLLMTTVRNFIVDVGTGSIVPSIASIVHNAKKYEMLVTVWDILPMPPPVVLYTVAPKRIWGVYLAGQHLH
jgi:hypothetical protein